MKSKLAILTVVAVSVLAAGSLLAAEPGQPSTGPWPGWHGPWMGFWWICPLMFLFMAVVFAVVCFGFRRRRGFWGAPWRGMGPYPGGWGEEDRDSPLDILNKRYARGEIGKDEYAEIKAAIVADEGSARPT